MPKNILVIGGTRFFGKLLVQRLVRAGHHVTIATRNYAPDPFGARIERVRVDRRNEQAMQAAFGGKRFDIVYDQMCHSPLDAAISSRVFKGNVGRYIMTSTVDVYRALEPQSQPFDEESLHVDAQPIDTGFPWHDPARAGDSQVAGKVQAEAYLYRAGGMPVVSVRMAHVLGGVDDYTGRLAHYVDQVRLGAVLPYTSARARTSFIEAREAADFLAWAGSQEFTGPVNAAADGALSAYELHGRVAAALQAPARTRKVATGGASPFDLLTPLVLDTSRAKALGYQFSHIDDWIDSAIRQHDLAHI
ncbi:NAD-dependent epimerase/dehydratase family protein [Telluria beijingensis]|uniref:NAD-dependent epimerase/dehydratase family protein n=1 Tax=Telluria beijingensis TaxID=3068633 RepID=UPI0027953C0C|nr:NAD-dependent epimerase/dehydratase family protein [Massilia sp. REN29]